MNPARLPGVAIVDDEQVVRIFVRAALQLAGFRVFDAADGSQAVRLLTEFAQHIDVILLDVMMPQMSGAEFLRWLRLQGYSTPVIICSGYSERHATESFHGLSFQGFLQKPFTSRGLIDAINKAVPLTDPSPHTSYTDN